MTTTPSSVPDARKRLVSARQVLAALRKSVFSNRGISPSMRLQLVQSFLVARLLYGAEVWGVLGRGALAALEACYCQAIAAVDGAHQVVSRLRPIELRRKHA
eukprot:6753031-Alexandrium_andersonii.AAC.1